MITFYMNKNTQNIDYQFFISFFNKKIEDIYFVSLSI